MPSLASLSTLNALPALPAVRLPIDRFPGGFSQELRLAHDGTTLACAHWHCPDIGQGVVQLISLEVIPTHRRQGLGKAMLRHVMEQSRKLHSLHRRPLRRLWANIRQKDEIIARALLTGFGFHHVASVQELFDNQEGLIYTLSFD